MVFLLVGFLVIGVKLMSVADPVYRRMAGWLVNGGAERTERKGFRSNYIHCRWYFFREIENFAEKLVSVSSLGGDLNLECQGY